MPDFSTFWMLVVAVAVTTAAGADALPFEIKTKRDNDQVVVKVEKEKAVFSVRSPFGISQAVIKRTDDQWPDAVVLRLYLKGLEYFRVTNDTVKIEASVSSQDGKVRFWKDGNEDSPLDDTSPFWIQLRMVGGSGEPVKAVKRKDAYFEMQLPKALFEGNAKSMTIDWIDFYRN
jgi:hypothetical protein